MSAILVIDGVQSINVLNTFENVRPLESLQNSSKLSCVNLVGSNMDISPSPSPPNKNYVIGQGISNSFQEEV